MTMVNKIQQAKQSFTQLAQSAENIMHELQNRLDYLQSQEPQYKQE